MPAGMMRARRRLRSSSGNARTSSPSIDSTSNASARPLATKQQLVKAAACLVTFNLSSSLT